MLSETCQIEGISSPESAPFPFDRTLFPAPSFPIARRSRLTFRGRVAYHQPNQPEMQRSGLALWETEKTELSRGMHLLA